MSLFDSRSAFLRTSLALIADFNSWNAVTP